MLRIFDFSILDRYLFRQLLGPFVVALSALLIMGAVDIVFYLAEVTVVSQLSWGIALRLLLFKLPAVMTLFFPMSVLFAVMLVIVRMTKDQELVVFQTSGVSQARIFRPVLVFMLLMGGLNFAFNELIVPVANRAFSQTFQAQLQSDHFPALRSQVVFRVLNQFFYVGQVNAQAHRVRDVVIFETSADASKIISAKGATWSAGTWTLQEGQIYQLDVHGNLSYFHRFKEAVLPMGQVFMEYFFPPKSPKEMTLSELRHRIVILEKSGGDSRPLWMELYLKFSIPFGCVVFGVLGWVYSTVFVRSSRSWWGIVAAIALALVSAGFYFFLMAIMRALALDGQVSMWMAAWLPNFFFLIGATVLKWWV